jgi:N-methylhydantoinase B
VSNTAFEAGGAITNLTGGGGGWGNAFEREPERVAEDVKQGFVSVDAAKRDYGVVVDPKTFAVDEAATKELRKAGASA